MWWLIMNQRSLTVMFRMMKAMKLAGNVNEAAVVQSEANY